MSSHAQNIPAQLSRLRHRFVRVLKYTELLMNRYRSRTFRTIEELSSAQFELLNVLLDEDLMSLAYLCF